VSFFSVAPDGKAVVFGAERGARSHIWRIDPPAPPVELTRDPNYSDVSPVWSPDGGEIAFSRGAVGMGQGAQALWIMRSDGTNPRRVADFSGQMAWLPDRKMLIQRGDSLLRLDPASGATEAVPGANARTLLTVDHTGQWLAYHGSEGKIMAVPAAGGTPRFVDIGQYEVFHPLFSPSSRWLYFQSGHKNLYRVPGPAQGWATATPQKVTAFSGLDLYIEDPKFSRDGSRLFYTRGRTTGDIYILHFGKGAEPKAGR